MRRPKIGNSTTLTKKVLPSAAVVFTTVNEISR